MVDFPTPEEMRDQFAMLCEQREDILEKSSPKRAERDRILNEANANAQVLEAEIRQIEEPLSDICQKQALIARALGGRTGA